MTINVLETGCLNVYVPLTQSGDLLNIADLGREDPRKHVNNEEYRFDDSRIPSVVATGGVYKGQGRNQRELMTHAY